MPSIGLPELIVVLMILLVVFGGARLPQIGDALGRAARGLKRGFGGDDRSDTASAPAPERPAERASPLKTKKAADPEVDEAEIVDRKS